MGLLSKIVQFYQSKIEITFSELNECAEPGGIVFLGDSITDFFRLNEYFHGVYVVNRGISWDTTDGVLLRMPESVYQLQPSKVFLMIGTNDVADNKSEQEIVHNIDQIISAIQANCPDTKIYLESLYPVSTLRHKKIRRVIVGKRTNEKIRSINDKLKKLAQEKNIPYIDVHSHLADEEGNIRLEYTVEGLHITVPGYRVVADVLRPWVME
ncbi:MAG: lysophospholipase [Thermoclostridium sp.]|nr:lysophospholipase [Thermoclostridium sp.]